MANVGLIVGAVAVIVGLGLLLFDYTSNPPNNNQQHQYGNNPGYDGPPPQGRSNSWDNDDDTRRRRVRRRPNNDCSICLEELGPRSSKLRCGHFFHQNCIEVWFNEGQVTCPNCRRDVK